MIEMGFILFWIATMLYVCYSDITRYIIPNWLCGAVIALWAAALVMEPALPNWQAHLAAFGIMLAAGFLLFGLSLMGGGDVKLMAALALWVGYAKLLDFVVLIALLGGVLALALWILRKLLHATGFGAGKRPLPRIFRGGEPVPYGVAIAIAFADMLHEGMIWGV